SLYPILIYIERWPLGIGISAGGGDGGGGGGVWRAWHKAAGEAGQRMQH
ncbi:unnamed protein product, partial [Urochloa humidicola]